MTLTYKGIKINYQVSGKGPHLVFLHGFLENCTMWNTIIPYFDPTHTCVSIDLLGHGKTDCLGYIHSMEDMAKAVKVVLDTLAIDKCIIIGHSMGGYVTLAFIDLFTEIVAGFVLLNSTAYPDSKERKENRARAIKIVKKNPDAYTSMAIANLFAEKNRSTFDTEIKHIKKQASKTPLQGIISALEGMKIRKDYRTVLANFKGAKIIFAGTHDPVLPFKQNIQEANISKTPLISLDGGHMSYLENKEQFIQSLTTFCNQK